MLAVDLDELVVTRTGQQHRTQIHTVAQAADPFDGPPSGGDEFWNAPFGAVLGHREVASVKDAVAFFHAGRDRVRSGIAQTSTS